MRLQEVPQWHPVGWGHPESLRVAVEQDQSLLENDQRGGCESRVSGSRQPRRGGKGGEPERGHRVRPVREGTGSRGETLSKLLGEVVANTVGKSTEYVRAVPRDCQPCSPTALPWQRACLQSFQKFLKSCQCQKRLPNLKMKNKKQLCHVGRACQHSFLGNTAWVIAQNGDTEGH